MNLANNKKITRKLIVLGVLLIGVLKVGYVQAEFPYDLNSGVVFTEELAVPGTTALVASMEETATLSATISGDTVFLRSDRTSIWPAGQGQNGTTNLSCCNANAWAFIQVDGIWYGATWEFIRPGSTTRALSALRGSNHLRFPPLQSYPSFPAGVVSDDVVGLMVSGITRNRLSFNNVRERSNIVFVNRITGQVLDPVEDLGFPPEGGVVETEARAALVPIIDTLLDN